MTRVAAYYGHRGDAAETLLTDAALALIGLGLLPGGRLGVGRLPGDIVIERDGVTTFSPLGSMILLGVVLLLFVELVPRL
jgi:hypothetical protein